MKHSNTILTVEDSDLIEVECSTTLPHEAVIYLGHSLEQNSVAVYLTHAKLEELAELLREHINARLP